MRGGFGRSPSESEVRYVTQLRAPTGAIARREARIARLLAVADVTATSLALLVSTAIIAHDAPRPLVILALPLAIAVAKVAGLYDRDDNRLSRGTLDEAPVLLAVALGYSLLFWLLAPQLLHGVFDRLQVAGLLVSLIVLQLGCRAIARRAAASLGRPQRCLAIGDVAALGRIARSVWADPRVSAEVVGQVDLEGSAGTAGLWPDEAALRHLADLITELDVDRAIIAPRTADAEETLDIIRAVKSLGVKVSLVPRLFEVVGSSVEFDEVNGLTLLGVHDFGLTRSTRAIKRTFDVVAGLVLLLCAAPIMTVIALLIRLESPGPIFFRQPRVGQGGRPFGLLKFRSMLDGADAMKADLRGLNETVGLFKIADDPRITRVGGFLRRASLDELPQLLNVLRGEMSIVGPRPLVADDDSQVRGWDRRRLHLTPGITGPWQILSSTRVPLNEMVKIDYLYAANWSLWGDAKILLRTVVHVLARRGL
jgi:exopolysaccharide biosynthesis polyprenyl glycosylphosphotransferase